MEKDAGEKQKEKKEEKGEEEELSKEKIVNVIVADGGFKVMRSSSLY